MKFDKRQTNIAKGMALLLLLWHHVFYKSEEYYGLFRTVGTIDGVPFESCVARYFKVCVAIFFFLSSFGMYKSWQNLRRRAIRSEGRLSAGAQVRFVKNHLIKVMMDFWFIYLIFVPLGMAFGVYFREVYEGSFGNGLLDFLCLSFFSRTPSMNPLEAMKKGIICIGGGEPENYEIIGETELRPIINVEPTKESVVSALEQLVLHPEAIPELKRQSVEYISRHHDDLKVARQYLDFWNSK